MNSPPTEPLIDSPVTQSRNWKLVLSYDGTDFHGWQVQPRQRTIQGELAEAIEHVTGERVLPQGSGRTDAGVHALGQVASFRLRAPIPAYNLQRALNRTLPPAIRVLAAELALDSFHARHSALHKTYEYRICREEICSPFLARYSSALNYPLNVQAMQTAASLIIGQHDFTSFAAVDPDITDRSTDSSGGQANSRTIYESSWEQLREQNSPGQRGTRDAGDRERDPRNMLVYRVRGSGFLHHMVRNLVGTFLEAGRGHISAAHVKDILAARQRSAAGPTAPACGLFLISVAYMGSQDPAMLP